jgi:cysteine sulfinate desulfinase/cysteine desulfurase-like protein
MPAAATTKAAIKRAIEAAQDAGLAIYAVSVNKDGSVRVETEQKKLDSDVVLVQSQKPKQWAARR